MAAITGLLGLVGLVAAAAVYTVRFQPVTTGSSGARPYAAQHRAFGFSLRNNGRFRVTVTGVQALAQMTVRLTPQEPSGVGPQTAFRPFELKSQEERLLMVTTTLPFCKRPLPASRSGLTIHTQTVHYSVLGGVQDRHGSALHASSAAPRRHDQALRHGIDEQGELTRLDTPGSDPGVSIQA